jgi:hypothetical protein
MACNQRMQKAWRQWRNTSYRRKWPAKQARLVFASQRNVAFIEAKGGGNMRINGVKASNRKRIAIAGMAKSEAENNNQRLASAAWRNVARISSRWRKWRKARGNLGGSVAAISESVITA